MVSFWEFDGRRFEFVEASDPAEARVRHDLHVFRYAVSFHAIPVELLSAPAEVEAAIAETAKERDRMNMRLVHLIVRARTQRREGVPDDSIISDFRTGVEAVWASARGRSGVGDLLAGLGVADPDIVCGDYDAALFGKEFFPVSLDWSQLKEEPIFEGSWSREGLRGMWYKTKGGRLPPLAATLAGGRGGEGPEIR